MSKLFNMISKVKSKIMPKTNAKTNAFVTLSEFERFHSDPTIRDLYRNEYPERYTTLRDIDRNKSSLDGINRDRIWRVMK